MNVWVCVEHSIPRFLECSQLDIKHDSQQPLPHWQTRTLDVDTLDVFGSCRVHVRLNSCMFYHRLQHTHNSKLQWGAEWLVLMCSCQVSRIRQTNNNNNYCCCCCSASQQVNDTLQDHESRHIATAETNCTLLRHRQTNWQSVP